jgi:hypothetical protein
MDNILELTDILPSVDEEIGVPINPRRGSEKTSSATAVWDMMDPETLRKYRAIYGGTAGRKGKPREATNFVAERKFKRFEGLNTRFHEQGFASEKDWLMRSPQGQYLLEFIIGDYLGRVVPDTDDVKE